MKTKTVIAPKERRRIAKSTTLSTSDYSKYNTRIEKWTYEKFLKLNPYNRNRDVDPRVAKVAKTLAKQYLPTHSIVFIGKATKDFGKYKKGEYFRLDGNTRTEVYKLRPDLIPNVPLNAIVIDIDNAEDAYAIYLSIDSSESVEKASEKVTGLLREKEYVSTSKNIKSGKFKITVQHACRFGNNDEGVYLQGADFETQMNYYWKEIMFLDKHGLDDFKRFSANAFAALLMVVKKYGTSHERIELLLENFKEGITTINNSTYADGVHYVYHDFYEENQKIWKISNFSTGITLISNILYYFDLFMRDTKINKKQRHPTENQLRKFYQNYFKK
jgi:hypothetical protein